MAPMILRRGDPSRRREDDYDVLEDGVVVGRIFLVPVAPEGRPWMWASGHGGHIARAAHGYAATREEAMAAVAKRWRRGAGRRGAPATRKKTRCTRQGTRASRGRCACCRDGH